MFRLGCVFLVSTLCLLLSSTAQAQFGHSYLGLMASQNTGRPAITSSGTHTVQRNPTHLRLYMQLMGRGNSIEDALAKLKQRREAAAVQLEAFKADKKSITFGPPSLSNQQTSRKKQLEMMVLEQMRNRGKKAPKGLQASQTVTVTATLVASWPLEAQNQEQLLILSRSIQEKIKQADLAGSKEMEKLSPEEEEMAEEAAKAATQEGEETSQFGQPYFLFVATLPPEEYQKAMTAAIKDAKTKAAQLAQAAGVNLGPLVGLSGACQPQRSIGDEGGYHYGSSSPTDFLRRMIDPSGSGDETGVKADEAIGTEPGKLSFVSLATVMYEVGK